MADDDMDFSADDRAFESFANRLRRRRLPFPDGWELRMRQNLEKRRNRRRFCNFLAVAAALSIIVAVLMRPEQKATVVNEVLVSSKATMQADEFFLYAGDLLSDVGKELEQSWHWPSSFWQRPEINEDSLENSLKEHAYATYRHIYCFVECYSRGPNRG